MRVKALIPAIIAAVCLMNLATAAAYQDAKSKSPALVKELVSAMKARQLTTIAAVDPEEPGRFIGAMMFEDAQLLVMSTKHKAIDYLMMQLKKNQFREVYDNLQQGIPDTRLFFHDMGCDGFGAGGDNIDIFYEGARQRTMLDGNWMAQSLTEAEYQTKSKEADEKYSRALRILLEASKKLPVITVP